MNTSVGIIESLVIFYCLLFFTIIVFVHYLLVHILTLSCQSLYIKLNSNSK